MEERISTTGEETKVDGVVAGSPSTCDVGTDPAGKTAKM